MHECNSFAVLPCCTIITLARAHGASHTDVNSKISWFMTTLLTGPRQDQHVTILIATFSWKKRKTGATKQANYNLHRANNVIQALTMYIQALGTSIMPCTALLVTQTLPFPSWPSYAPVARMASIFLFDNATHPDSAKTQATPCSLILNLCVKKSTDTLRTWTSKFSQVSSQKVQISSCSLTFTHHDIINLARVYRAIYFDSVDTGVFWKVDCSRFSYLKDLVKVLAAIKLSRREKIRD